MPPRICRVVTVPMTFTTLLRDQIQRIRDASLDLTLVCSPGDDLTRLSRDLAIRAVPVPMARAISPVADARSLAALTGLFRRERFDLVHSSTPKAGLLTAIAGRLAGIRRRLHTFTGQPWVEMHGAARWMTREADRFIGRLDTDLYADSHSQREFLLSEGVGTADRLRVIGDGSISGVDVRRFDPDTLAGARGEVRARLGIPPEALVIVFVGRLTRDKGIRELVEAFADLSSRHPRVELLLVGPEEPERDPLPDEVRREIATNPRIHPVGFSSEPERYLAAADLFCLPSYREGFGSVVIEAGAMRLPSVATRVTGLVDAVVENETGLLVPAKEVAPVVAALERLIVDAELRARFGLAARARAITRFDADAVNGAVVAEYHRLLQG